MKCPRCQAENNAQARFCVQCGYSFNTAAPVSGGSRCANCGAMLQAGVKFCTGCGAPVGNVHTQQMPEDDSEGTMILEDDSEGTMILDEPYEEQGDDSEGTMILEDDSQGTMVLGNSAMPFTRNTPDSMPVTNSAGYAPGMSFAANQSDETTMLGDTQPGMQNSTNAAPNNGYYNNYNQSQGPNPANPVQGGYPPANPVQGGYPRANSAQGSGRQGSRAQSKSGGGSGVKIAIIALCVLIAAAAVVLVLVWKNVIKLPFGLPAFPAAADAETQVQTETDDGGTEKLSEADELPGVTEEQLSGADELLGAGKDKIGSIEELMDGTDDIRSAIDQYQSLAAEYGMSEAVSERMDDAYDAYVSAVIKHKDFMAEQELSGGIYAQVMSELEEAASRAEELADAGFDVDTSLLESETKGFDSNYRGRIIKAFNEFASRDSWSRTEAWNLMDDTDIIFGSEDLDDPLRLRYCYALAWWTQKQIETELNSSTITQKGAAIKIAGLIEATDYNLMLVNDYIQYMHVSDQDCYAVESAYNEIIDHLAETQGIRVGQDIDLAHFWYFNDFGEYSVDSENGVTPENRQWIRQRMSSVTFE